MRTRPINAQRMSVTSARPFENVVAAFESAIGHPDLDVFQREIGAAKTNAEMEGVVQRAVGRSGFMEFARFDLGAILRKDSGKQAPRSLRFVIGNPLVMKEMVKHVPDAGSYAPVSVLIDERSDGVHLSYDTMAGFLAAYGSAAALNVARDLDSKIEDLVRAAAA